MRARGRMRKRVAQKTDSQEHCRADALEMHCVAAELPQRAVRRAPGDIHAMQGEAVQEQFLAWQHWPAKRTYANDTPRRDRRAHAVHSGVHAIDALRDVYDDAR